MPGAAAGDAGRLLLSDCNPGEGRVQLVSPAGEVLSELRPRGATNIFGLSLAPPVPAAGEAEGSSTSQHSTA